MLLRRLFAGMDSDVTNLTLKALRRILRATDLGGRRLATATGLTPSQLLVLQEIDRRGEATPGIIASSLQFGQATVTNILDRLEGLAFVTRQRGERDKRQIFVRATAAGQDILKTAPDLLQVQFRDRSEEHTSELQSLMRNSYAVFCLKKKK